MPHFRIEQTSTAVILWEGEAATGREALDLMAQEAGAESYASIPEEAGGGDTLVVTELWRDRDGEVCDWSATANELVGAA